MRAGATRVAGVVLLLALLGEPSPAAEGDPWQTAHVQSVLGLWAGARAEQLIGQTKTAVRLYRLAEEQADKSFQRSVPPLERMILTELSKRIKAALAKLSQNGEGLTDQLRRPQHVIADLVRLKAQADLDRAKLRTDDARVRYEVLAHAARLVRRRFPQSDQAKAAAWLESRARASVLQLAQRPAEGLPQRQRFIGDFKHFATRSLAGDLLHVFHPKVPGPVRFRESARPSPPRVPGVSSVVAALEQAGPFRIVWGPTKLVAAGGVTLMQECIAPLPAADPGAPDVPARVADAAAKIYLEGLSGDTKLLDSPAAVRDALDTIRGAGVRKQALVNLANILAAKKTGAAPGGITMGAPALPDQTLRPALLETYLHVLQTSPELDQSGALTRKALGACVQLGRLDARAAVLKERLRKGPPGLLGVLLYRVLRADRRNRAASDLLVMMLGDPDRFFPQSLASTEALSDGFQLLRSSMKLDVARSAAEVLARREPSGAPRRLLLLAEAHLAAKRREEARTLLAKLVADYPLAPEASRAAALLVPEKPATGELAKQLLTDDQLAALAKLARANPLQYMRLADEYRRARHYAKAREAYGIVARRFDRDKARLAIIDTYFEEGKHKEGLRAAEVYVQRYPTSRGAAGLLEPLQENYLARRDEGSWAGLCLRIADRLSGPGARPYLDRAADVLSKHAFLARAGSAPSTPPARLTASVQESGHRGEILRLVAQKTRMVRAQIATLAGHRKLEELDLHRAGLAVRQSGLTELVAGVELVPIVAACQTVEKALQEPPQAPRQQATGGPMEAPAPEEP